MKTIISGSLRILSALMTAVIVMTPTVKSNLITTPPSTPTPADIYSYYNRNTNKVLAPQQYQYRNGVRDRSRIWPGGIVPFTISHVYPEDVKETILKAMREIEANVGTTEKLCVRFKERDNEKTYVSIRPLKGCNSPIGYSDTGVRVASLGPGCELKGVVMHELLHVLGFYHEQNRYDRDSYVNVNMSNVLDTDKNDFYIRNDSVIDNLGLPYDFSSIMHYGPYNMAKNDQWPVMTPKPHLAQGLRLGQRLALSRLDVLKVQRLYQCQEDTSHIEGDNSQDNVLLQCDFNDGTCGLVLGYSEVRIRQPGPDQNMAYPGKSARSKDMEYNQENQDSEDMLLTRTNPNPGSSQDEQTNVSDNIATWTVRSGPSEQGPKVGNTNGLDPFLYASKEEKTPTEIRNRLELVHKRSLEKATGQSAYKEVQYKSGSGLSFLTSHLKRIAKHSKSTGRRTLLKRSVVGSLLIGVSTPNDKIVKDTTTKLRRLLQKQLPSTTITVSSVKSSPMGWTSSRDGLGAKVRQIGHGPVSSSLSPALRMLNTWSPQTSPTPQEAVASVAERAPQATGAPLPQSTPQSGQAATIILTLTNLHSTAPTSTATTATAARQSKATSSSYTITMTTSVFTPLMTSPDSGDICVDHSLYQKGPSSYLSIYLSGPYIRRQLLVSYEEDGYNNYWVPSRLSASIPAMQQFRLEFEATLRDGVVAIDDLFVLKGYCE